MAEENTVWETRIVNFLNNDPILRAWEEVPSLTRRVRHYRSQDFRDISRYIRDDRISVLTGYDPGTNEFAAYVGKTEARGDLEDYFIFNTYVELEPTNRPATLVHEATHAIQDDRRMKLSYVEKEMDAWFVMAVYALRTLARKSVRAEDAETELMALMNVPPGEKWSEHPMEDNAVKLARRFLKGQSVRDAGDLLTALENAVRAKYKNAIAFAVERSGAPMHTDDEALTELKRRKRMNGIRRRPMTAR
jgi:hypothetical protein